MRIKYLIVSMCGVAAAVAIFLFTRTASAQTQPTPGDRLPVTTCDSAKPYEVIDIVMSYQEFKAFSFKGDPLVHCLKAADAEFQVLAKKAGANAVIGVRFDFENRTEKDEGRLLAYGTLVRFK